MKNCNFYAERRNMMLYSEFSSYLHRFITELDEPLQFIFLLDLSLIITGFILVMQWVEYDKEHKI